MSQFHLSASAPELFDSYGWGPTVAPSQNLADEYTEAGITARHTHESGNDCLLSDMLDRGLKRYPRKKLYKDLSTTHKWLEELGQYDVQGTKFLDSYAGNTSRSRNDVVRKYRCYLLKNSRHALIRRVDNTGRHGGGGYFECHFPNCNQESSPKRFPSLQKIAPHILGHLGLKPWVCGQPQW
jgi:hypothetical protein